MKDLTGKVFAFMEEQHMLEPGDRVVAGISGGADSVCLLLLLLEYRKKVPFHLAVAHVNHGIRKEASYDAAYVKDLCESHELPFFLYEKQVLEEARVQRLSTEEAGRKLRYEAFRETFKRWNSEKETEESKTDLEGASGNEKIAVAHHLQDSAETLLFNLFRGSGIWGLTGIRPVRGRIIRPLLIVERREIEDWLKSRKISWCIDSTNEEDTYTRNKLRNHILPYVEREVAAGAVRHMAATALEMGELADYVEAERQKAFTQCSVWEEERQQVTICLKDWRRLNGFLKKQVLLLAFEQVGKGRRNVGRIHVDALMKLAEKEGYKKIDLPGNLEGVKEYGFLRLGIRRKKEVIVFDQILKPGESYDLGDGRWMEISLIKKEKIGRIEENRYTKYLDYDKINNCLILRFRKQGDYLVINEAGQKKSVKEYMIQEKIAASLRNHIPLIADGSHILWIIGHRISAYYKVSEHTKTCIQIRIQ